jgi:hypothetical protein
MKLQRLYSYMKWRTAGSFMKSTVQAMQTVFKILFVAGLIFAAISLRMIAAWAVWRMPEN